MTPNNITGMAKLLGLDVIALTDHNTSLNCGAAIEAGKRNGVYVIPGMEGANTSITTELRLKTVPKSTAGRS